MAGTRGRWGADMIRLLLVAGIALGLAYAAWNVMSPSFREAGYRWQADDFPLFIDLGRIEKLDGLSADEVRDAAQEAMAAWNRATARELFREGRGANFIAVDGAISDPAETHIEPSPDDASRPSAFHILVSSEYRFSVASTGERGRYDLPTVLAHELGHVLGLSHPVPNSPSGVLELLCMVPPWNERLMCPRLEGHVMRSPGRDDLSGFWSIYEDLR